MAGRTNLQIQVEQKGGDCVVEILRESLLHEEAPRIAPELVAEVCRHATARSRIVLDFARVVHMNSNAVSVLLLSTERFRLRGHGCVLTRVPEPIRRLFDFMCLGDHFTLVDWDQIGEPPRGRPSEPSPSPTPCMDARPNGDEA